MAIFRTYAEVLRPDHPLMKMYKAGRAKRFMKQPPGAVLGDVLGGTGGTYETTTQLTAKFREDIREIAELTSDGQLLRIAELPEVPVSLEPLRHLDPQTRILVGYRLDATAAESPRWRRRLALPPGSRTPLGVDEVVIPDIPGGFWHAFSFAGQSTAEPGQH